MDPVQFHGRGGAPLVSRQPQQSISGPSSIAGRHATGNVQRPGAAPNLSPPRPQFASPRQTSRASPTRSPATHVTNGDKVIKRERSLSPPLSSTRRLVTSGSKFIGPVPLPCAKGRPTYPEERKKWAREEIAKLTRLGLTPEKYFIRDDGMVIDWISPVPVWSDTLLPGNKNSDGTAVVVADMLNEHARSSNSAKRARLPKSIGMNSRPPQSNDHSQNLSNVPAAATATEPMAIEDATSGQNGTGVGNLIVLDRIEPSSQVEDREMREREITALEDSALDFYQQYIKTFDSDRASLASAYSRLAVFSYTIHDTVPLKSLGAAFLPVNDVLRFAPRNGSRNLVLNPKMDAKTSRIDIISSLLSLGPHQFSSPENIFYDVVYVDPLSSVFLVCQGTLTDKERKNRLSYNQSFVLRRKEDDEEDRKSEGLWPLVIVSHQLTVRDMPVPVPL
ncbi:hypothetical protein BD410DRAFT_787095 [Rickenella mellea]|uniref:NTF2 domain-containing protein n=1 Tax=Rickenella mellea TaxID=50990 RepID=A0A4Y7Q827_9AGAM|nr:hypothetical protein BD410DRAFT_787095 [Rickenella mellea]